MNEIPDDLPDDFWPLIESICDQAGRTWQSDDPRMKYVEVQIDKADLDMLREAYGAPRLHTAEAPVAPTLGEKARVVGEMGGDRPVAP